MVTCIIAGMIITGTIFADILIKIIDYIENKKKREE